MEANVGPVRIECVSDDIARQDDMDAVVNAANARLQPGGGVAGALHAAAGPDLASAGAPLAPIRTGQAVITDGFRLPNRYVVHCLGPVYGVDRPEASLLADCYRNALALADAHDVEAIAFPAISTGAFGYPLPEAARIAVETVAAEAPGLEHVRRIRFVVHDPNALRVFSEVLRDVARDT